MKKIISYLVVFWILLLCCNCTGPHIKLIDSGKSDYRIVISADADFITQHAAKELQFYIYESTGCQLQMITDAEPVTEREIWIGRNNREKMNAWANEIPETEGFVTVITKPTILIAGGGRKGTLYGVYDFLEKYLECRMFNANNVDVPLQSTIKLPHGKEVSNPVFQYRETLFPIPIQSQKYADWHKLHNRSDIERDWGLFVHTYQVLIPAETYFDKHPEWFSEINGKRIKDGQLCLTNEEMRKELVQNLSKLMEEKPDAIYWSVSDNDNYNHCDCEACRTMDEQYGAASGSLLWFVNQIAAEFPDKIISTLGYQFSRKPPKNIKPAENVNIMLCSIECNRALPLADDPGEVDFRKDVEGWTALTSNIFLWDYVVQFRNYFDPFPNLHILQPNLKYFADQGIEMMFEQGSNMDISEFHELRSYLIAKLLWNPYQDANAIIDDFMKGYYGDAAPFIRQYIDTMSETLLTTSKKLNIYGYPIDAVESYLTPSLIKEYTKLFDQAETAVANNSRYADRVAFARMPLEFAILDLSTFEIDKDLSFFKDEDNVRVAREDMLEKLDLFYDNCEKFGVSALAEWNVTPPAQFKKNILNMIEKGSIKNLASGKPVDLLTSCSPKYNPKGAAALTDGLFGFLDYRYHWLGFEGEDMEAVVDLGKITDIGHISVNFLEVPLSWIFYPVRTTFYTSTDKINWQKVGALSNPITEDLPHYTIRNDETNFPPISARYVKVVANSLKTCPEWHRGFGLPCWIFADEIVVK